MTNLPAKLKIFNILSDSDFNDAAIEVFKFQYANNGVYHEFVNLLGVETHKISSYQNIPFLPIEFYKTQSVASVRDKPEHIFLSSGTTTGNRSRHLIFSISLYQQTILKCFNHFYGSPENYIIAALCPDYISLPESSLSFMLDFLIKQTKTSESGFYLNNIPSLVKLLNKKRKKTVIVFGITYALMDFAELYSLPLENVIILETGGMKGKRKEMTREEVHECLKNKFFIKKTHSEYSMCELLSQAYSSGEGIFVPPPWMKIFIRDAHDPLTILQAEKTGGVNIIDLSNIYTCSFIATGDLGVVHHNGSFTISGRFDHSDTRGCNLLQSY
ncbi:MAG: acyltransferase [Bacteroidales bacterium]|jgi:hypothetical protein|nr:acyltransferase [Bacteroidales bacterium]MDD4213314.1 acyltransferase [Bacteroidales bacterium]